MEVFLPRIIVPGRGTPQPLFPGYMFVRPQGKWRRLRSTYGVIDVVMMGEGPDYVPKAVMQALKRNADTRGIVTLPRQRQPKIGEPVEIKVGAWQGFKGLYDGLDPNGRIRVLLSMFGRRTAITVARQSSVEVLD